MVAPASAGAPSRVHTRARGFPCSSRKPRAYPTGEGTWYIPSAGISPLLSTMAMESLISAAFITVRPFAPTPGSSMVVSRSPCSVMVRLPR